jgi:hypothetical protein
LDLASSHLSGSKLAAENKLSLYYTQLKTHLKTSGTLMIHTGGTAGYFAGKKQSKKKRPSW